jgi:hypothetical protein
MLDRLRYTLGRSLDRIVLEDSEGVRTVRLEIGSQTRFIDFSKADLTFSLRREDLHGAVLKKKADGESTYWIPQTTTDAPTAQRIPWDDRTGGISASAYRGDIIGSNLPNEGRIRDSLQLHHIVGLI